MEEWKEYRLGELCSISSSKRIFAEEYKSFGIPFYRGKEIIEKQKGTNISTELYISESRYEEIKNKFGVPQKGDMLLTSVGTLGIPYIIKDETFYFKDGNLTWFYNFNGINSKFLYYWFLSPTGKNTIEVNAIGSTQKALTIDTLSKIRINIPNFKIQNKIVAILSSLDEKIELNRRINFEPFKNGKFVDSELGKIPEDWRVGTIEELCQHIASGSTPSSMNKEYYNGNIKWFTTKELNDTFLLDSEKHISEKGHQSSSTKMFPTGTVLMAIYAAPTVGRLGILTSNATFNQAAVGLTPKQEIGSYYIFLLLKNERNNFNNLAIGAAQQNLSVKFVKTYITIIPSEKVIYDFNIVINPLFDKVKFLNKQISSLTNLRDTLLPKLMSGELKIE